MQWIVEGYWFPGRNLPDNACSLSRAQMNCKDVQLAKIKGDKQTEIRIQYRRESS